MNELEQFALLGFKSLLDTYEQLINLTFHDHANVNYLQILSKQSITPERCKNNLISYFYKIRTNQDVINVLINQIQDVFYSASPTAGQIIVQQLQVLFISMINLAKIYSDIILLSRQSDMQLLLQSNRELLDGYKELTAQIKTATRINYLNTIRNVFDPILKENYVKQITKQVTKQIIFVRSKITA